MADTSSTETTESNTDTPQWLFSFGASNVKTRSNHKGHMKFIFNDDDSSLVTAFTDRPDRLTDRMSIKNFAKNFDEIFGDDKPNASLTHWEANGSFHNHVYKINSIKKRKGKYILKSDLIESDFNDTLNPSQELAPTEPPVIKEANFFVDGAVWSFLCQFFTGGSNACDSSCDWGWIDGNICPCLDHEYSSDC